MKRVGSTQVLGIGQVVKNLLTGELFEFSPDMARASFYALTSAGEVRVTILVGMDTIADDVQVGIGPGPFRVVEDVVARHGAFKGERITFRARQVAGAGNVNLLWSVVFEPVAV